MEQDEESHDESQVGGPEVIVMVCIIHVDIEQDGELQSDDENQVGLPGIGHCRQYWTETCVMVSVT